MILPRRRDARFQDSEPQFFAERAHLDHEAAGEPRAHAVVEAFEIGRRTVGRDHHLAAGIDQRVQRVAELGLGRFALQELQVVDHQHVDAAQRLLEGERRLRLQRRDEAVHEFLGGEIEHLALAAPNCRPRSPPAADGFCRADAGVDVERVEHHGIAAAAFRDLRAAACASVLERPITKLPKVRRGSSGEPPSASWLADTGAIAVARSSGAGTAIGRSARR
jgi:hypothetical protein